MVWEFQCPVDGCEFSSSANEETELIEAAQQHVGDKHGNMPTREEVEQQIIGPR